MDAKAALEEMEALAEKLGVKICYEKFTGEGMSAGGLCKLRGEWRVIIERRLIPNERLGVLADALSDFDLEEHFLSPSLRQMMDRIRKQKEAREEK